MAATHCVPMAEWECFGDDDDDEDEDDDGERTRTLGVPTPLVLAPQPCEPVAIPPCPPSRQPELWADHPPLYMGPMRVVSGLDGVGGGRGFAATDDLAAGTLLLVEQPFLPFIRQLNDDGYAIVDDGADEGAPRPTAREMPTTTTSPTFQSLTCAKTAARCRRRSSWSIPCRRSVRCWPTSGSLRRAKKQEGQRAVEEHETLLPGGARLFLVQPKIGEHLLDRFALNSTKLFLCMSVQSEFIRVFAAWL